MSGPDDRGIATVAACLGVAALLAVTGLGAHWGAAVLARQRAETGADLAALAGAARVLQGPDAACAAALRLARANGLELRSCSVRGADLLVVVQARAGIGPFSGVTTGRARAGPVQPITEAPG